MSNDTSPIVDEANDDEYDDEHNFDEREPVLRFACGDIRPVSIVGGLKRTIYADVNKLHGENGDDNDDRPFPCCQLRRPVLSTS